VSSYFNKPLLISVCVGACVCMWGVLTFESPWNLTSAMAQVHIIHGRETVKTICKQSRRIGFVEAIPHRICSIHEKSRPRLRDFRETPKVKARTQAQIYIYMYVYIYKLYYILYNIRGLCIAKHGNPPNTVELVYRDLYTIYYLHLTA